MRPSPLDRKLLRDLLAMRGQAIAIALVVAAGVSMFVAYLSNFDSLRRTVAAYYAETRFADVFVSLRRAPLPLAGTLAGLPGVAAVEPRVVANVTLDVPGLDAPASGHLVGLPEGRRPTVNDLVLRRGRWPDPARDDEVLASEPFADAHAFRIGDALGALINGRARRLRIVGVALSPEFVYSIPPGEIIPDDRRFGVLWMNGRALASAFDLDGGFNDVVIRLSPGAMLADVMARVDRALAPYGGRGAVPRARQFSAWTLDSELAQLETMGVAVPAIFLLVAAFVLNIALTRVLALQRPELAALKALGYGNAAIGWHYVKWGIVITAIGAVVGVAAGAWLGAEMIELYNQYFRFPALRYRLSPLVAAGGAVITAVSALAGTAFTVRRAVRIPPAAAMRPPAPGRYRPLFFEEWPGVRMAAATRMVVRNVARQPLRALAGVAGIALAVGVLMVGFVFVDAMQTLIETQFFVAERQDVTVSFAEPVPPGARESLAGLPGVLAVESRRVVPIRLRAGHRERTLVLTGLTPDAQLTRVADRDGQFHRVPPEGVLLSARLAQILALRAGDRVRLEALDGARRSTEARVAGVVDDTLGLAAYMDQRALQRWLREPERLTGASLRLDPAAEAGMMRRLKALPAVAGAAFKRQTIASFRDTLAQNMNLMIGINLVFAGIIAFGVVYNTARVSLSERSRELASLRVLGFTRGEISGILLGELFVVTLVALPVGVGVGQALCVAIVGLVESDVYRFPLTIRAGAIAWAGLAIVGAATLSALAVRRRLDTLDLVAVLKVRE